MVDGQPNTLTYSLIGSPPAGLSINETSGVLTWTPTKSQVGTHNIEIQVNDGRLSATAATLEITVTDETPPVITTTEFTVDENQLSIGQVVATDPNGTTPTFLTTLSGDDAASFVVTEQGVLSFKSDASPDFETKNSYTVAVTATDGALSSIPKSITVNINDINDAPTIIGTPATTVAEGSDYSFTPTGTDVDAVSSLTYSIANKPSWATFSTSTGKLSGTPTNANVGTTEGIIISG